MASTWLLPSLGRRPSGRGFISEWALLRVSWTSSLVDQLFWPGEFMYIAVNIIVIKLE